VSITLKPHMPRVGDLVECTSEMVSGKSPCAGPVIGVGHNGVVAVQWSDTIQTLYMSWSPIRATTPTRSNGKRLLWKITSKDKPYHPLHSGHVP